MAFFSSDLPYKSNNDIRIESSTSFSSQPSLPSIPSLSSSLSSQQIQHFSTPATFFQCIATLKGHSSYVFSLAFGGENLYSGSSDREIHHWSRDPNAVQEGLSNIGNGVVVGNGAVKCLVALGDNKLFSAHQDHKIRVWKIDGGDGLNHRSKCIATLPVLSDRVNKMFSTKNYYEVRHVDAISALAISKDGSLLYSASWDRTFKIWRTSDFHCIESVSKAHDDAINDIVISTDNRVYTCSSDKKIKIWNKKLGDKNHTLVATLEKHKSSINALALSNDSSVLYSGACDRSILVWEKLSGDDHKMVVIGALRGHKMAILCLTIVTDDLICSGSADKTIRVWKRGSDLKQSYSCLAVFEGHEGPVKCLVAAVDEFNCCFKDNYRSQSQSFSDVDHMCKSCVLKSTTCRSQNGNGSLQCITDDDGDDDGRHNCASGSNYLVYSGSMDCDIKIWRMWVPFI